MEKIKNYEKLSEAIVSWLINYSIKSNTKGYVIGISGGVDSALVSTLLAKTGLPVTLLEMPINQHDSSSLLRAKNHINWLKSNSVNVKSFNVDLTKSFDSVREDLKNSNINEGGLDDKLALANTQSRLRMLTLRYVANLEGKLVAGTGNKVEDFGVGFFTVGGDGSVDISPISDMMKSEVRDMAKFLGVAEDVYTAVPTDGLWGLEDGHVLSDEEQIGASYNELEWAMNYLEDKDNVDFGDDTLSNREKVVLTIYLSFNAKNRHKMEPIPSFNTSEFREEKFINA